MQVVASFHQNVCGLIIAQWKSIPTPPQKINGWNLKMMFFLKWISSWGEIFEVPWVPCWNSASFPHSPTKTPNYQMNPWIGWSIVKEFPTSNLQKVGSTWTSWDPGSCLGDGFLFNYPATTLKCWHDLLENHLIFVYDRYIFTPSSPILHPQVWRWCDLPSQHLSILRPFHGDHLRGVDLSRLGGNDRAGETNR